jgi:DNA-binding GntR family transcriptional regulator
LAAEFMKIRTHSNPILKNGIPPSIVLVYQKDRSPQTFRFGHVNAIRRKGNMNAPILAEQIADQLRREILLGELAPGARMSEREKAHELGVSRTPMREAIRILARDGLLQMRPSSSPTVIDPSLQEVEDDLAVVASLEALAGELACEHATGKELSDIRKMHDEFVKLSECDDRLASFEADLKFHRAIAKASHNKSLYQTYDQYLARLCRVRYLSARQDWDRARVIQQHGLIVDGLEARNAKLVKKEAASHIKHIKANIQGLFRDETP